jgi:glutathione synthase/RimK-type ligase-like ATP-grasp enzyme
VRIALAGCAQWAGGHGDDAGLVEAFEAIDVEASWHVWDDPAVAWERFDAVVLRQTWDYPDATERFLAWIDGVAATTGLVNPAPVVRWNVHKGYLADLGAAGVAAVPTVVVPAGATLDLAGLGWAHVVVKPAVGVGGDGAHHGAPDEATQRYLDELVAGSDVIVQPYLSAITTSGETSVIILGGTVSHAVCKRPAAGEFRIHEHRGGAYEVVEPTQAQVDLALAGLAAAESAHACQLAYARADLVDDGDRPRLLELELVEPSLYLHHVPAAADRLAAAVLAALV